MLFNIVSTTLFSIDKATMVVHVCWTGESNTDRAKLVRHCTLISGCMRVHWLWQILTSHPCLNAFGHQTQRTGAYFVISPDSETVDGIWAKILDEHRGKIVDFVRFLHCQRDEPQRGSVVGKFGLVVPLDDVFNYRRTTFGTFDPSQFKGCGVDFKKAKVWWNLGTN